MGGVFVVDEGYPNDPFVGVLELLGSIPFALSIANRSLPGTAGVEGAATGGCCVCGKAAWAVGGVEVFCWAFAIMSARFREESRAWISLVCGAGS